VTAAPGERFSLFGSVNDEGLPRAGTLRSSWTQTSGPGTVAFENAAAVELTGSDGELTSSARVLINVK
jgi:hypothetical protein